MLTRARAHIRVRRPTSVATVRVSISDDEKRNQRVSKKKRRGKKQADSDGPTLHEGKCIQKTQEDMDIDVTKIGRASL